MLQLATISQEYSVQIFLISIKIQLIQLILEKQIKYLQLTYRILYYFRLKQHPNEMIRYSLTNLN